MQALTIEELIGAAQAATGLDEFDSDSFVEPLGILVDAVNDHPEAERFAGAVKGGIVQHLANRLRVADHLRRHPELEDAPLDVPLIVIGLPRTGTTLVSYLLDCDRTRWRSLLNWEALDSVPPATTETLRTDRRCLEAKAFQEAILPKLPIVPPHWEWADGPTECTFLHSQDFKSVAWFARIPSRTYADYLLHADMRSAYEYEKKVLRVLQSKAPGRWALKMPSHALFFRDAVEAFPDARFVWTHRNPIRALASRGATLAAGQQLSFGQVDVGAIHDVAPGLVAEHATRVMTVRESMPDDRMLDVSCNALIRDPVAEMHRIYDWLGEELTPEVASAMRAWKAGDDERQRTRSPYSIEDYGWSEAEVAPLFDEYLTAYPDAKDA